MTAINFIGCVGLAALILTALVMIDAGLEQKAWWKRHGRK